MDHCFLCNKAIASNVNCPGCGTILCPECIQTLIEQDRACPSCGIRLREIPFWNTPYDPHS
jgi:hypothetical protein